MERNEGALTTVQLTEAGELPTYAVVSPVLPVDNNVTPQVVTVREESCPLLTRVLKLPVWLQSRFQPAIVTVARERLCAHLKQALQRDGLAGLYTEQFDYYRTVWLKAIDLQEPPMPGERAMLEELALWYLLYGEMGSFAVPVPALRCFLYHRVQQEPRETWGEWIQREVNAWYKIATPHFSLRGQIAPEHYLTYDDLQDLFQSAPFLHKCLDASEYAKIKAELLLPEDCCIPPFSVEEPWPPEIFDYLEKCARYKTYLEKSHASWGNLRGWFSALRNHYALFAAHLISFYGMVCWSRHSWRAENVFGGMLLCGGILLFKWVLNGWMARPQPMPESRASLNYARRAIACYKGILAFWKQTPGEYVPRRKDGEDVSRRNSGADAPHRNSGEDTSRRKGGEDAPRPDADAPCSERRSVRRKQARRGAFTWTAILVMKFWWTYLLFSWLRTPTDTLLVSKWLVPGGQLFLLVCLWLPFIGFFFLDTFALFAIAVAAIGYVLGKAHGIGHVRDWRQLQEETKFSTLFQAAQQQFYLKIAPQSLSEERKEIAWALTWNLILLNLYDEDRLPPPEVDNYRYKLKGESLDSLLMGTKGGRTKTEPGNGYQGAGAQRLRKATADFLDETIETLPDGSKGLPDFRQKPENALACERLLFFVNSLFMDMPVAPTWERIPSRTVLTPVHYEHILYPFAPSEDIHTDESLNSVLNTGRTRLEYLIARHPTEWRNFVARLRRRRGATEASLAEKIANGERPDLSGHANLESEIRFWASFRFQALARTARGIDCHREALILLARLHFPTLPLGRLEPGEGREPHEEPADEPATIAAEPTTIAARVKAKLQHLVFHEYAKCRQKPELQGRAEDIETLMQRYPAMEVNYVAEINEEPQDESKPFWSGAGWYSLLMQGGSIIRAFRLPGGPLDGKGESKPEKQNMALLLARGEKIQVIDMNQDDCFEEALKIPNCLAEFNRPDRPGVRLVGYAERIVTEDYGSVAAYAAFADRVFVTLGLRVSNWFGTRMHYGHPDIWDGNWAATRGGVSRPSYISEDIFGAYAAVLQGAEIVHVEYLQAGKAREVGVESTAGQYAKFGSGAAEQTIARSIHRLNTSSQFPLFKRLTHFYGALGFYFAFPVIKYVNLIYLVTVVLMGISGFIAASSEVYYGVLGLAFAQSILFAGFAQLALERGVRGGLKQYAKLAVGLVPFFSFHILTQAAGFSRGLRANVTNPPTGRGFLLHHRSPARLYLLFRRTHIGWGVFCMIVVVIGLIGGHSYPLIWSSPFIIGALAAVYVPFLFNAGGTPLDVGGKQWWALFKEDIRRAEDSPDEASGSHYAWKDLIGALWARRAESSDPETAADALRRDILRDYQSLTGSKPPCGWRSVAPTLVVVWFAFVIQAGMLLAGLCLLPWAGAGRQVRQWRRK